MATTDLLFYVFLLTCVLWYLRYKNNQFQTRKFVFRMSVLKDKLNQLAYKGVVKEDEMFQYFSKSIDKVIQQRELLNMYSVMLYSFRHRNNKAKDKNIAILKAYCETSPELESLYYKYCRTILQYIKGQHQTLGVIVIPILALAHLKKLCHQRASAILKSLLVYPETSESSSVDLPKIYKRHARMVA